MQRTKQICSAQSVLIIRLEVLLCPGHFFACIHLHHLAAAAATATKYKFNSSTPTSQQMWLLLQTTLQCCPLLSSYDLPLSWSLPSTTIPGLMHALGLAGSASAQLTSRSALGIGSL